MRKYAAIFLSTHAIRPFATLRSKAITLTDAARVGSSSCAAGTLRLLLHSASSAHVKAKTSCQACHREAPSLRPFLCRRTLRGPQTCAASQGLPLSEPLVQDE